MRDARPALMLVVESALVLTAVAVWVGVLDTTQLPKAVIVSLAGVGVLGVMWLAVARRKAIPVPPTRFAVAVGGFVLALVVAAIVAGDDARSITGTYARWTGLAVYSSAAAVGLAVAAVHTKASVRRIGLALMAATGVAAVYGLVQRVGADPIDWVVTYEGAVFSSLGNPNFLAAFLGIGVPVWVVEAVDGRRSPTWRTVSAVGVLLLGVVILWTSSLQGLLAAGAGVWFVAFAGSGRLGASARRRTRVGLVSAGALAVVVGAAGVAGAGPLATFDWTTLRIRAGYWRAGIGIWLDHSVFGAGPTGYADHYRQYRTVDEWLRVGTRATNDSAHNVVIDMLVSGGVVLGLAYLAVLVVVLWGLLRAVRSGAGDPLLVGAVGGAWVAWFLQAMVSIDVPPLALTGWILAGAVVSLGFPAGRGEERPLGSRIEWSRRNVTVLASLILLTVPVVVGAVWMVRQFGADAAARRGEAVLEARPAEAVSAYGEASSGAPWEPRYPFGQGNAFDQMDRLPDALSAYERAAGVDPWWWDSHIAAARLSAFLGDLDRSASWYERVMEIEPVAADMKFEAGRVAFLRGRPDEAVGLLETALAIVPDQADWWLLLAEARAAAGDEAGADAAHRRAVELDPSLATPGG